MYLARSPSQDGGPLIYPCHTDTFIVTEHLSALNLQNGMGVQSAARRPAEDEDLKWLPCASIATNTSQHIWYEVKQRRTGAPLFLTFRVPTSDGNVWINAIFPPEDTYRFSVGRTTVAVEQGHDAQHVGMQGDIRYTCPYVEYPAAFLNMRKSSGAVVDEPLHLARRQWHC